jgi:hypothetical protein
MNLRGEQLSRRFRPKRAPTAPKTGTMLTVAVSLTEETVEFGA